jgi:cytochrome bd-type quinol oxidase subunit 1
MRTFFLSIAIGLATGVICFFLSVAFLCFVLLIVSAIGHNRADFTLAYKVAAPVAILAMVAGFTVTLVRGIRSAMAEK